MRLIRSQIQSDPALQRFPIGWTHLIEKESLQSQMLEHILVDQIDSI
jgi:hypothetical protein